MSDNSVTRWKVGCASLRWRQWRREFVVFDPRSGDTHVLNAVAAEALRILESSQASASELAAAVGRQAEDEGGVDREAMMGRLIERLDELGLVEPVSS